MKSNHIINTWKASNYCSYLQRKCLTNSLFYTEIPQYWKDSHVLHLHEWWYCRADSRFVPSQWETVLLCNSVSHWLGASLESALYWYGNLRFKQVSFVCTQWHHGAGRKCICLTCDLLLPKCTSLVQIITCWLFNAKPLPEPMMTYSRLDPQEQTSVTFK